EAGELARCGALTDAAQIGEQRNRIATPGRCAVSKFRPTATLQVDRERAWPPIISRRIAGNPFAAASAAIGQPSVQQDRQSGQGRAVDALEVDRSHWSTLQNGISSSWKFETD